MESIQSQIFLCTMSINQEKMILFRFQMIVYFSILTIQQTQLKEWKLKHKNILRKMNKSLSIKLALPAFF